MIPQSETNVLLGDLGSTCCEIWTVLTCYEIWAVLTCYEIGVLKMYLL